MIEQTPVTKDWVDILQALVTPAIAFAGVVIAIGQWKINKARLKHELFEKRYAIYRSASDYLGSIMRTGKPLPEEQAKFIQGIQGAKFIFDGDICRVLDEIWEKSITLECIQFELKDIPVSDERSKKCREVTELKKWLHEAFKPLEQTCGRYLELKHK